MNDAIRISLPSAPRRAAIGSRSLDEVSRACLDARCERARQAGREEALLELSGGVGHALEAAAVRLDEARERAEAELAVFAVELSVEIAGMLTRKAVDAGQYDIERIVREALAASGIGRGACVIHLAPGDIEHLDKATFRAETQFAADPHLNPGDVHVTTPRGLLVRELDACLASIREALFESLP